MQGSAGIQGWQCSDSRAMPGLEIKVLGCMRLGRVTGPGYVVYLQKLTVTSLDFDV